MNLFITIFTLLISVAAFGEVVPESRYSCVKDDYTTETRKLARERSDYCFNFYLDNDAQSDLVVGQSWLAVNTTSGERQPKSCLDVEPSVASNVPYVSPENSLGPQHDFLLGKDVNGDGGRGGLVFNWIWGEVFYIVSNLEFGDGMNLTQGLVKWSREGGYVRETSEVFYCIKVN